jgi:hypothetical protein
MMAHSLPELHRLREWHEAVGEAAAADAIEAGLIPPEPDDKTLDEAARRHVEGFRAAIRDLFARDGDATDFGIYCAGMFAVALTLIAIGATGAP